MPVPAAKFEEAFGLSWNDALAAGSVYNALDAVSAYPGHNVNFISFLFYFIHVTPVSGRSDALNSNRLDSIFYCLLQVLESVRLLYLFYFRPFLF